VARAAALPVTAASYNIYSKPTAVSFGSLDSDAFTFDPKRIKAAWRGR
jgi:hypothetical protein